MALLPTVHVDSLVNPGEVEIIRRLLAESRQGEEEETPSGGRDFALRGAGEDAGAQSDGPEHPDLDGGRVSGE